MTKIIVVSTEIESGRGGIQSALRAYCEGFDKIGVEYQCVMSHRDGDQFYFRWLVALIDMVRLGYKYRSGKAVFWFHCGPWISLLRKCSLAIIPKIFGCKIVGHLHSHAMLDYLGSHRHSWWSKMFLSPYDQLIVLTPWWKKALQECDMNTKYVVSGNPVGLSSCEVAQNQLAERKQRLDFGQTVNILSMSRLREGKGFEVVIKAMTKLSPKFKLTIAGDGPFKEKLKTLVAELKLVERVRFLGWVAGESKNRALTEADIFCLPSKNDSFGVVFIEAMAYDLPVIALDRGPIRDVVTEDVGVLCDGESVNAVKSAIESIAGRLEQFSGRGPERVLSHYHPVKLAEDIRDILISTGQ